MTFQSLDELKNDPSLRGHEALYAAIALDAALKRHGFTEYQVSVYGRTKTHGIRFFNDGNDFHPVVFVVKDDDEYHLQADTVCALLGRLESMPVEQHQDMLDNYLSYECDVFFEAYERHDPESPFRILKTRCPDTFALLRSIAQDAVTRIDMGEVDEGPQPFATATDAFNAFNNVFRAARSNIRQRQKKAAKDKASKGKAECRRR